MNKQRIERLKVIQAGLEVICQEIQEFSGDEDEELENMVLSEKGTELIKFCSNNLHNSYQHISEALARIDDALSPFGDSSDYEPL